MARHQELFNQTDGACHWHAVRRDVRRQLTNWDYWRSASDYSATVIVVVQMIDWAGVGHLGAFVRYQLKAHKTTTSAVPLKSHDHRCAERCPSTLFNFETSFELSQVARG